MHLISSYLWQLGRFFLSPSIALLLTETFHYLLSFLFFHMCDYICLIDGLKEQIHIGNNQHVEIYLIESRGNLIFKDVEHVLWWLTTLTHQIVIVYYYNWFCIWYTPFPHNWWYTPFPWFFLVDDCKRNIESLTPMLIKTVLLKNKSITNKMITLVKYFI